MSLIPVAIPGERGRIILKIDEVTAVMELTLQWGKAAQQVNYVISYSDKYCEEDKAGNEEKE